MYGFIWFAMDQVCNKPAASTIFMHELLIHSGPNQSGSTSEQVLVSTHYTPRASEYEVGLRSYFAWSAGVLRNELSLHPLWKYSVCLTPWQGDGLRAGMTSVVTFVPLRIRARQILRNLLC